MGVEMSVAQEISRSLQLNAAISVADWRWMGKGLLNQTTEAERADWRSWTSPCTSTACTWATRPRTSSSSGCATSRFRGFYVRPSFLRVLQVLRRLQPRKHPGGRHPAPMPTGCPPPKTSTYISATSSSRCITRGYSIGFRASVLNVLNEFYFTDVSNRNSSNVADPNLLNAFFNRGRTFTVGLSVGLW